MALTRGTFLDSCEILELLGSGGMGEVYRGRDRRLNRDVAVKTLPAAFARDEERLSRFEREAQALASLNHPNIAIIHDFKEAGGECHLILELVEGETLAERIARGAVPLDETLAIALQMADALTAAHDKGIVHRDLKPANVKITPEGRVKVLDFGLAKIHEASQPVSDPAHSPTISAMQTGGGVILGTAAYMSPDQARGKPVDRRADVWGFGCVLYEMLSGRKAFPNGETASDTLAAILTRDPDWQALPAETPSRIRALLERCLRKDERRRWREMADVRTEIEEAVSRPEFTTALAAAPERYSRREAVAGVLAIVFLVATAVGATGLLLNRPIDEPELRFEILNPDGVSQNSLAEAEISPDGSKVAFLGELDGKRLIFVQPFDSTASPLPGTEGAGSEIFWSADSQFIGFSTEDKLKKVPDSGGPAQTVGSLPAGAAFTGTWNADGVILLGPESGAAGPLLQMTADGQVSPVSELDPSRKETAHALPHFLPDGRHYLFLARSSDPQNRLAAWVGELGSKQRRPLPGVASEAKYADGHLVFIRERALMAQQFDASSMEFAGEAFPLADPFFSTGGASGPFSVSTKGGLAFFVPSNRGAARGSPIQLTWFDQKGMRLADAGPVTPMNIYGSSFGPFGGPDGKVLDADASPDGRYIAFSRGEPADIFLLDVENSRITQLTFDPAADLYPQWSKDGTRIAFVSERDGVRNLYERTVFTVGADEPVLKTETSKTLTDRSGDDLVYISGGDVWVVPTAGPAGNHPASAMPRRVTATTFTEVTARLSPNGRWIAYASNEGATGSGRQVHIESFPEPGLKQQVSTSGGEEPRWSADSTELFYREGLVTRAVSIGAEGGKLKIGPPRAMGGGLRVLAGVAGQRFLFGVFGLATPGSGQGATPSYIKVMLHWTKGRTN